MKCIIVDDEPKAIEILVRYTQKMPELDLVASFDRPLDALAFLNKNHAELVFLDINMPEVDGLQLSKLLKDTMVVFTTAYPQFALESYDVNAIDYLLKPISFPRFLKAVEKARAARKIDRKDIAPVDQPHTNIVCIKSGSKMYRILIDEIDYLETQGNNIVFHTKNTEISSRLTVNDLFKILPMNRFVQIHKSFIVPKDQVLIIEAHQVTTKSNVRLPIGAVYRGDFMKMF